LERLRTPVSSGNKANLLVELGGLTTPLSHQTRMMMFIKHAADEAADWVRDTEEVAAWNNV
jgi:hypothetical protein